MSDFFFTADTHFGHANIIKYCNRPFSNVAEMDDFLITQWNSVVGKDDIVFHLGDFSLSSLSRTEEILNSLNGRIILVHGNHDVGLMKHPVSKRFLLTTAYRECTINNIKFVLFHYPIASWNGSYHGAIHLYGHRHGKQTNIGEGNSLSMDVGVDTRPDFRPWSFDEIIERFVNKLR